MLTDVQTDGRTTCSIYIVNKASPTKRGYDRASFQLVSSRVRVFWTLVNKNVRTVQKVFNSGKDILNILLLKSWREALGGLVSLQQGHFLKISRFLQQSRFHKISRFLQHGRFLQISRFLQQSRFHKISRISFSIAMKTMKEHNAWALSPFTLETEKRHLISCLIFWKFHAQMSFGKCNEISYGVPYPQEDFDKPKK